MRVCGYDMRGRGKPPRLLQWQDVMVAEFLLGCQVWCTRNTDSRATWREIVQCTRGFHECRRGRCNVHVSGAQSDVALCNIHLEVAPSDVVVALTKLRSATSTWMLHLPRECCTCHVDVALATWMLHLPRGCCKMPTWNVSSISQPYYTRFNYMHSSLYDQMQKSIKVAQLVAQLVMKTLKKP